MRVPLIASWPGKIAAGKVVSDLVDLTDFLPTLCDAAGVVIPAKLTIDGRSLLPQLRGERGNPRDWLYSYWVPLVAKQAARVGSRGAVEQAFDHRYKLYSTGSFFDLQTDPDEKKALRVADLKGEAGAAAKKLQAALEHFKDARPAHLPAPPKPGENRKARKAK
jgi:arylsulfatase A